jgi:hypothetical protein
MLFPVKQGSNNLHALYMPSYQKSNFVPINMKKRFAVFACAIIASMHVLNVAYAQIPLDLFKKAAEVMAKPEQPQPQPQSPAAALNSVPPKAVLPSPDASGSPSSVDPSVQGMQNPEVQMLLTSSRASSWADAQKKAVTKVSDGDPLWIYLKTAKPLKDYVYSNEDNPNSSTGQLSLVISPRGTYTSLSQRAKGPDSTWPLRPEEMKANEIAISLAPGGARSYQLPGASSAKSGKATFFLNFVAGSNAEQGLWENEIFVIGNKQHVDVMGRVDPTVVRQVPMAVAPITVDVSSGFNKYKVLNGEECSVHPGGKPCKVRQ